MVVQETWWDCLIGPLVCTIAWYRGGVCSGVRTLDESKELVLDGQEMMGVGTASLNDSVSGEGDAGDGLGNRARCDG